MHTLDDVLAEVTKEDTEIGGITALINGLRKQVADAVATQTIPPPVQARIEAIFDAAVAHNAALVQAIADPGEPKPPEPAPAVDPQTGGPVPVALVPDAPPPAPSSAPVA